MTDVALPAWLQPLSEMIHAVEAQHLAPRFPNAPDDARSAAVLMLFSDGPDGPDLTLTERASTMRTHAGQISFPGGSVDPGDIDAADTALREAVEEVGLPREEIMIFGELPRLWLPPNNFAVTTVLGYWPTPRELVQVDVAEVETVLRIPLAELMDPRNRFSVVHPSGWRGPGFDVGIKTPLWGFTAGVIARLFAHAGWEEPWDETLTRPAPVAP